MVFPSRPSFPSSPSESGTRRLGARSSTAIERPIRAQMVLLGVGVLFALAIPLYILRTPSPDQAKVSLGPAPLGFAPSVPAGTESEKKDERVELSEPTIVKCAASQTATGKAGRLCDTVAPVVASFQAAIVESFDCAPRTGEHGTLNYVLSIDFTLHRLHVFPGASGTWKGPQARRATECVKRALPAPDWEALPHEQAYYEIAVLATYKPPPPTEAPLFE